MREMSTDPQQLPFIQERLIGAIFPSYRNYSSFNELGGHCGSPFGELRRANMPVFIGS
jgi:hypothetical protein